LRIIFTLIISLTASFVTIWIIGLSHNERNELKLFKNYLIKSLIK